MQENKNIFLKVRQSRNVSFKPMILPKNKRTNSVFFPNSTKNEFVHLFFERIRGYQKVLRKLTDLYYRNYFNPCVYLTTEGLEINLWVSTDQNGDGNICHHTYLMSHVAL